MPQKGSTVSTEVREFVDPKRDRIVESGAGLEEPISKRGRTLAARTRRPNLHPNYMIPVLEKTLKIIAVLDRSGCPMTMIEVCHATGYPKTTVYRILRTLTFYGFIPDGELGLYSIGRTDNALLAHRSSVLSLVGAGGSRSER